MLFAAKWQYRIEKITAISLALLTILLKYEEIFSLAHLVAELWVTKDNLLLVQNLVLKVSTVSKSSKSIIIQELCTILIADTNIMLIFNLKAIYSLFLSKQ